jgi:hypothetical protein
MVCTWEFIEVQPIGNGTAMGCHSRPAKREESSIKAGLLLEFIPAKAGAGVTEIYPYN